MGAGRRRQGRKAASQPRPASRTRMVGGRRLDPGRHRRNPHRHATWIAEGAAALARLYQHHRECHEHGARPSPLNINLGSDRFSMFNKKAGHPEKGRKKQDAAIAILDIGRMNDGVQQQTQRVYENMALLALDLFARVIAMRIDAAPPFSALFTLWLSTMAAVGLASRSPCSRHAT